MKYNKEIKEITKLAFDKSNNKNTDVYRRKALVVKLRKSLEKVKHDI